MITNCSDQPLSFSKSPVCFYSDNKKIAIGKQRSIEVHNLELGVLEKTYTLAGNPVCIAFKGEKDRNEFHGLYEDGRFFVLNLLTEKTREFEGTAGITHASDPNDGHMAVLTADGLAVILDLTAKKQVCSFAFSPRGAERSWGRPAELGEERQAGEKPQDRGAGYLLLLRPAD